MKGEGRCCYGGVSYPDPMVAPLPRWMKAPRPAVVAVTNLLRFSARLEARGRGSPPHPAQSPPHPPTRPSTSPHLSLNTHSCSLSAPLTLSSSAGKTFNFQRDLSYHHDNAFIAIYIFLTLLFIFLQ